MHELGFKALVVVWLGFGVASIVLLFAKGMAARLVRRVSGGGPLGYVALAALLPLMFVLGTLAYLTVMISEDARQCKSCGNRKAVMQLYCPNCEQRVAVRGMARAS